MKLFKKTSEFRPHQIQHTFRTVCNSSRFVGLWPFTITYHANGSIKDARVRLCDSFRFLIAIGIHLIPIYNLYLTIKYARVQNRESYFPHMVLYITLIPTITYGIVGIVLNLFFRNTLANILKNFNIFDTEVCVPLWKLQLSLGRQII